MRRDPSSRGGDLRSASRDATPIRLRARMSSIDDLLTYCRAEPDVQALIRGEVAGAGVPSQRPGSGEAF